MIQQLNEKISVIAVYDSLTAKVMPHKFKWNGREYKVHEVGYYHRRRVGRLVEHVFNVTDGVNAYRLVCNGDTLIWTLQEVSDGNAS